MEKFQSCSLFSPVFEFADQETAVQTATAVLDDVMSGAAVDEHSVAEQAAWNRVLAPEAPPATEEVADPSDAITPKEVSRRLLLGINAVSAGETA